MQCLLVQSLSKLLCLSYPTSQTVCIAYLRDLVVQAEEDCHTKGSWFESDAIPSPALSHLPQSGAGDGGGAHKAS